MSDFYVYLWLRQDGTPYYVGKGKKNRVGEAHRIPRPKDRSLEILQAYENESDAFYAEKFFISLFGRKNVGTGILRNLVSGGQGCTGLRHSAEMKEKMSAERIRNLEGQVFNHLTVLHRGPDAVASKSSRWWCQCDCGNPHPVLVRRTGLINGLIKSCGCARLVWKGRSHSESTKEKLRLINTGKKWEKRSKVSPLKGKSNGPFSEERKRRLSRSWTSERKEALITWNRSRKGATYR